MVDGQGVGLSMIGDHGGVTSDASVPESGEIPPAPRAEEPGALRPTGRPNARLLQTIRDMVISLAVVFVAIGAVMLVTWRPAPEPVRVVDPTPALLQARIEADYPVLYPADLDAAWRPTSARWEVTDASTPDPAWHVGFVTPEGAYAQIGQTASEESAYASQQIGNAQPAGEWNGWLRYDSVDERALVRVDGGVTIIVSGTAPWPTLQLLAERLSPTALPTPAGS